MALENESRPLSEWVTKLGQCLGLMILIAMISTFFAGMHFLDFDSSYRRNENELWGFWPLLAIPFSSYYLARLNATYLLHLVYGCLSGCLMVSMLQWPPFEVLSRNGGERIVIAEWIILPTILGFGCRVAAAKGKLRGSKRIMW